MKTGKMAAALLAAGIMIIGGISAADRAAAAGISNANQAREKALKKVPNAVVTDTDQDYENGERVYEIELVKGSKKYDITYRASDGKMSEYGWEKTAVSPNRNRAPIGEEKCRQLASERVKNAVITSFSQKTDDGVDIYKVKMTAGNRRYTLKYHARTGALTEYQWKLVKTAASDGQNKDIGMEKAKQIALKEVKGAVVYQAEYDIDDGVAIYEIALIKGNYEYEFKIDAASGTILEWDKDLID